MKAGRERLALVVFPLLHAPPRLIMTHSTTKVLASLGLVLAAGFSLSAHATPVITTPAGASCRQQFSSDASNVQFNAFGEISNKSTHVVPIVCSLPTTRGDGGLRLWIDGSSPTNSHVSCGASVFSFLGGARASRLYDLPAAGGRFDAHVDFGGGDIGAFDYVVATCSLPPFASIQGFGAEQE